MTSLANDSQIAGFLERLPANYDATGSDEPMVIFRGAMDLSREQENFLVAEAIRWAEDLDNQTGRTDGDDENPSVGADMEVDDLKHIPKRAFWERIYNQRLAWRRHINGIYKDGTNIHFPMTRRIVNQMISRAQNYFFQTEPYFSANAVGVDIDTGKAANDWAQYRFSEARVKEQLEQAVSLAFQRGEAILKTQVVSSYDYYESFAMVMVDADGKPIMGQDGDYVFDTDEAIALEDGTAVLKRDGTTPMTVNFVRQKVRRKSVIFKGPRVSCIPLRDFVASTNEPTLQEENCLIHYYDMEAIQIVEEYLERLQAEDAFDPKEYPRVLELLNSAAGGSRDIRSGGGVRRPEIGDPTDAPSERSDPLVRVGEFHMWCDVNQDGIRENVTLLLDMDTKRPILYDYTANMYENQKRPFTVVRAIPVDGRWTGISAVEIIWQMQKLIDLNMNRWDFSNSQSGSVTFWNPELVEESAGNKNLKLNNGRTYRKRDPKTKATDIIERVPLNEYKGAQMQDVLQWFTQMVTNLGGVANVNDANMAGLDSTKLATGIRNMDASGQEQFAPFLSALTPGLTETAEACLILSIQSADDEETYEVLGEAGAVALGTIQKRDLKRLRWALEMELTRYKSEQEAKQAQFARPVAVEYYKLPPILQTRLISLYQQELKAYGVRNVDSIIVQPTQDDFAAYAAAQQQQAAGPSGSKGGPGRSPSLT